MNLHERLMTLPKKQLVDKLVAFLDPPSRRILEYGMPPDKCPECGSEQFQLSEQHCYICGYKP